MNATKLGILVAAGMALAVGGCANMYGPRQQTATYVAPQPDPTVEQVQRTLVAQGYNLRVDGVMGPETQSALKTYQEQHGLQPTGQLDAQTRSSLNLPT